MDIEKTVGEIITLKDKHGKGLPNNTGWKTRHLRGVGTADYAIVHLITNAARWAQEGDDYWDKPIGQDGYGADYFRDLLKALLAFLNFELGDLDGGTLDRSIRKLAELTKIDLDA